MFIFLTVQSIISVICVCFLNKETRGVRLVDNKPLEVKGIPLEETVSGSRGTVATQSRGEVL